MNFSTTLLFLGGAFVVCQAGETGLNETNDITIERKIYNGQYTWDYNKIITRLEVTYSDTSAAICSGTVISDRAILTAASCLERDNETVFMIKANIYYKEYIFWDTDIIVHPDYNSTCNKSNLAILTIKKTKNAITDLTSSEFPRLIPTQSSIEVDDVGAIIYGYGKTSINDNSDTYLRKDFVNTVSEKVCKQTIQKWKFDFNMTERHICSINEKRGACWGDEGGALIIERKGVKYLAGIIAEPLGNCGVFGPTIYTRISSYYSWINEKIH